jgi:hypothetical protein
MLNDQIKIKIKIIEGSKQQKKKNVRDKKKKLLCESLVIPIT